MLEHFKPARGRFRAFAIDSKTIALLQKPRTPPPSFKSLPPYRDFCFPVEQMPVHVPLLDRRAVLDHHFSELAVASFGEVRLQLVHGGLVQKHRNHRPDGRWKGLLVFAFPVAAAATFDMPVAL